MCYRDNASGAGNKVIGSTREYKSKAVPTDIDLPGPNTGDDEEFGSKRKSSSVAKNPIVKKTTPSVSRARPRGIGMGASSAAERFKNTYKNRK